MNTILCPIRRGARHGRRDRAADGGRGGRGVSRCIRHAGHGPPQAIGPLTVTMIQPPVGVLLVALVRRATLLATRLGPTTIRAVPLSAVTGPADPKRRAARPSRATPLVENDLRVLSHPVPAAGLDRTGRSWQGLHAATWRSLADRHTHPGRFERPGFSLPAAAEHLTPFPPRPPTRLRRG